jgi:hypothetical protein
MAAAVPYGDILCRFDGRVAKDMPRQAIIFRNV